VTVCEPNHTGSNLQDLFPGSLLLAFPLSPQLYGSGLAWSGLMMSLLLLESRLCTCMSLRPASPWLSHHPALHTWTQRHTDVIAPILIPAPSSIGHLHVLFPLPGTQISIQPSPSTWQFFPTLHSSPVFFSRRLSELLPTEPAYSESHSWASLRARKEHGCWAIFVTVPVPTRENTELGK
jgi:hypothetical protein